MAMTLENQGNIKKSITLRNAPSVETTGRRFCVEVGLKEVRSRKNRHKIFDFNFSNPRMFAGYGRQRGWEREMSGNELPDNEGGFVELSEEEVRQLELPKEWIA